MEKKRTTKELEMVLVDDFKTGIENAYSIVHDLYEDQIHLPDSDNPIIIALERHIHTHLYDVKEALAEAIRQVEYLKQAM